jgi:RNA polymerase sigma-70 factor (ECF subfamily)
MAESAPTAEELLAHSEWLTRLSRALVGDAAADDVVQETYEAALAKSSGRTGPLRPWLGGVARNVARMTMRGRTRRERREQAVPVHDDVPSPEQLLARAQVQQQVNRLVLELPEPLRATLLLRFFEGMSAADIARAQGIPAATVRSRLKDALDRIRAGLDKEHDNRRAWIALLLPAALPGGGAKPAIAGTLVKLVFALLVVAAIVAGTRVAGLWGGSAAEKIAETPSSAPSPGRVANRVRTLPTIRDADPDGSLRLEGQVVDEHDAPVAHAIVAIDTIPPKATETESDGGFVFERLLPRDYRIEATAGVRYAGPARLRLATTPDPVTLRMRDGSAATVTVTDRVTGKPIGGAEVDLMSWLSALTWKATTNASGVARLTGIGAGWSPLVVRASGYAQAAIMFATSGAPGTTDTAALSLARGTAITGRIVDDHGSPVANARVLATSASDHEPVDYVDPLRDAVTTGADGAFTTRTLSAGTWRLTATAGSYAPTTSVPIALDGVHSRSGIELRLLAGAVVRGSVVDSTGSPAAGAQVSVVTRGLWRVRRQTVTDARGNFSLAGLEPRPVDIVAWHDRGASAIVPVDLAANRDPQVTLTLDLTGAITGRVVDDHGQPIADAQVIATPDGSVDREAWSIRGAQETTTDQAGGFRFAGLSVASYRVRAARPSASESVLRLSTGVTTKLGAAPIEIVVPIDRLVTGKIQLANGAPVTAFTLAFDDTRPLPTIATDGAFAIRVPTGTYNLTIAGPSFVTTTKEVAIAKDTDLGTLAVTTGRSISGRVLDAHGEPVLHATVVAGALLSGGGARLYIKGESVAAKDTETDAEGRFLLAGFPPGSLTVIAGKPNTGRSASVQLPASPDSVTLDLVLAPTSSLEGKAMRNGQPLGNTIIIASPIGAMWSSFVVGSGADGTFVFDALAPGAYIVYPMLGRGGRGVPGELHLRRTDVALGTANRIDLDATPGSITLALSVKTDKGTPVPMAGVGAIELTIDPQTAEELRDGTLVPSDRIVAMHGGVVRDGAASLSGLRPGPQTVCAMLGDPRVASSMKIKCTQLTVTTAPKQTASLVVPEAWLGSSDDQRTTRPAAGH